MDQRDVVIIGGGPAGYVAAIRVRQHGGTVALIERDAPGGTCLHRGCIPTRALIRGTEFTDMPRRAREYGVSLGAAEVDLGKMMSRKDTAIKTMAGGLRMLLEGNGVEVLKGDGRLLSPSRVRAGLEDGTISEFQAGKIIIATGARHGRPSVQGSELVSTTDDALALTDIPGSVLVLGAGPIGLAFANILSRLGAGVTVATEDRRILPVVDAEIVAVLDRELKRKKIRVCTGASLLRVTGSQDGEKTAQLETAEGEIAVNAELVLSADARRANLEGLGLEEAGVGLEDGRIRVGSGMETSVPGIYAAGDVTGEPMLAHVASAEGRVAADNAMGRPSRMDYTAVPHVVYTSPEIACAGLTEEEAARQGHDVRVGRFSLAANGMATILGERGGSVKIIAGAQYGQVLGMHVVGPSAAELVAGAGLAIGMEATPAELANAIFAHPSLAETLKEAALDVTGEALHASPSRG